MPVREMLSLMPVFDAILAEGSISRAAERLGVTPSAVSQSLSRLRKLADDDLFEATGRGVRPTPRALAMSGHIQAAMAAINAAIAPMQVDLATLDRTFVIDVGAGFDALLMPLLFPAITKEAPHVKLLVSNIRGVDLVSELKFGRTELAFDFQASNADGIRSERVGRSAAVVISRKNHPMLLGGLSKDLYLKLPHAGLVWNRSSAASGVALELDRLGVETNNVVSVPTLMALAAVVASSDLIATTSQSAGRELAARYRLCIHPLPFAMPDLHLYFLWHARFELDAAHRWLRQLIKKVSADVSSAKSWQ